MENKNTIHYTYDPLKNVIIGFTDSKEQETYLKYDPKNFEKEAKNKKIKITNEEKNLIKDVKKSFIFISENNLIGNKIKRTEEWTQKQIKGVDRYNKKYPKEEKFNFALIKPENKKEGIGIMIEIKPRKLEELKKINPEFVKNKLQILKPESEDYDKLLINTSKLNGNYLVYGESRKPKNFINTMEYVTQKENYKKLNPNYSKFVAITTEKGENPQILRFTSAIKRANFIKESNNIIKNQENNIQKVVNITNFNSIAIISIKEKKMIDMHKIKTGKIEIEKILKAHNNTINKEISKQQKEHKPIKQQQTKAIIK